MRTILLLITIAVFSCSPKARTSIYIADTDIYGALENDIPKSDSLIIKFSGTDTLSIGKYAVTKNGELSVLRTGFWKTFHQNGKIKDLGEYKIGSFIDCCVGGACMKYYHYRVGNWKYFKENGELKYELNFQPDSLHVDTRCQGGDHAVFGLVKDFSRLEYKYGLTPDDIFQLQKVEIEDDNREGTTIAIPISGELIFKYKEK